MSNCHRSEKIESLRGRYCRITFKDGEQAEGTVDIPQFGIEYVLRSEKCDIRFFKSHVKKIEALTERGTR